MFNTEMIILVKIVCINLYIVDVEYDNRSKVNNIHTNSIQFNSISKINLQICL